MYIFMTLDVLEERKCGALVEHMPNEQGSLGLLVCGQRWQMGRDHLPATPPLTPVRVNRVEQGLWVLSGFREEMKESSWLGERHVEVDAR